MKQFHILVGYECDSLLIQTLINLQTGTATQRIYRFSPQTPKYNDILWKV